ncbi:nickel ABC transporter permease [Paenibacillus sp. GCM10027626]|uniref:nickel ABC transporter permease n=1 Tax=Paenibacillus sp. GCM10027626 TaxID=3273411 RepID=UPI00363B60CB
MNHFIKRILWAFPTLLGISLICFLLLQLVPGEPAELLLRGRGIEPTAEQIADYRSRLGLDRPLVMQYLTWLLHALQLDFGTSFRSGLPVTGELLSRLPATLELLGFSFALTMAVVILAGFLSALYKQTLFDQLVRMVSIAGLSLPSFWLGLILLYFLSVRLQWFPLMGRGGIAHLILPSFTLSLGIMAQYARLFRSNVLEVLEQPFMKAARAKGIKRKWLYGRHAFRSSLIPLVAIAGTSFGQFWGGSVTVEVIFSWPGLGKYMMDSISARDYPVIQSYIFLLSLLMLLVNILTDAVYALIDPRIRFKGADKS